MTIRDKIQLLEFLKRWNEEELDCKGSCFECWYGIESRNCHLDSCPTIAAYDMIYRKLYATKEWNKRKG